MLALLVWQARPLAARLRRLARGRVRTGVALGLAVVLSRLAGDAAVRAVSPLVAPPLRPLPAGLRRLARRQADLARRPGRARRRSPSRARCRSPGGSGGAGGSPARPALVAIGVLFVLAQPLVVQPLFNRFEPLAGPRARGRDRGAREPGWASTSTTCWSPTRAGGRRRRTRTSPGSGPTRRVVLYDTLLDGRFTAARSAPSPRTSSRTSGGATSGRASPGSRCSPSRASFLARLGRPSAAAGSRSRGSCRSALAVAFAFSSSTLPLQNAVSRRYEAEADWLALQATATRPARSRLERRFALTSLGDPDPPAWVRSGSARTRRRCERIAMAEAFRGAGRRRLLGEVPDPLARRPLRPESFIASSSSRMKRGDMFTRLTTTPGTSPSSTSWSMRANVIVNS